MRQTIVKLIVCLGVSYSSAASEISLDDLLKLSTAKNGDPIPSTPTLSKQFYEKDEPAEKARLFELMNEKGTARRSTIKSVISGNKKPCFVVTDYHEEDIENRHSSMYFREVGRANGVKEAEIFFPASPLLDPKTQEESKEITRPLPTGNTYKVVLKHITLSKDDLEKIKGFIRNPEENNGRLDCLVTKAPWIICGLKLTDPGTFYDKAKMSHHIMLFKAEHDSGLLKLTFGYQRKKFLSSSSEQYIPSSKDEALLQRLASLKDDSKANSKLPNSCKGTDENLPHLNTPSKEIDDYWEKDKYDLVKIELQRKAE